MALRKSAEYGLAAIQVGTPDLEQNDDWTNAVDVITNVLHAAASTAPDLDVDSILSAALGHFLAEQRGDA